MSGKVRSATHAGDWYSKSATKLEGELTRWLDNVDQDSYPIKGCKAVIAPHAGYAYSGPTAAWAYKAIDPTGIKRVFILGPSHHLYLDGCALSSCSEYETPIGNLPLDRAIIDSLKATNKFSTLSIDADQAEHSLEMHLPYVRKIFQGYDIAIVPILVGSISKETESAFGAVLAPYLASEDTLFVVSSDFCHWGTRFSYTYYYPDANDASAIRLSRSSQPSESHPIHESIRKLDGEATDILTLPPQSATAAHEEFSQYLGKTKNTICGRHPIGVLLGALSALEKEKSNQVTMKWVKYEQSSACLTTKDSSVSYASAWVKI
ncbi:hypothetical protein C8J56DRAFT_919136 [Mycena floridula]|nr:hypothetical protein C8J56DRAFT_919136 [Mycena floridula]